jgi:hypothetical protein
MLSRVLLTNETKSIRGAVTAGSTCFNIQSPSFCPPRVCVPYDSHNIKDFI